MNEIKRLSELRIGDTGTVTQIRSDENMKKRLLDLGLVTGTPVYPILKSPTGDPVAYTIRGALIALRKDDAANILVRI